MKLPRRFHEDETIEFDLIRVSTRPSAQVHVMLKGENSTVCEIYAHSYAVHTDTLDDINCKTCLYWLVINSTYERPLDDE